MVPLRYRKPYAPMVLILEALGTVVKKFGPNQNVTRAEDFEVNLQNGVAVCVVCDLLTGLGFGSSSRVLTLSKTLQYAVV